MKTKKVKAKKQKTLKEFENGSGMQGVCPSCNSKQLVYEKEYKDEYGLVYPWKCSTCGAIGKETYDSIFSGHYNRYEK